LAEFGCSANQIAAISGHKSLSEVERYTIAANQERMARMGGDVLFARFSHLGPLRHKERYPLGNVPQCTFPAKLPVNLGGKA
jgi:hypothetical protein